MREPEMYRLILESLIANSNGKRVLSVSDVSRHLGKTRAWCRAKLGVTADGIAVEALAMKLAKDFC